MQPENAEFLAALRELVIADITENEADAASDLCSEHWDHTVRELTLGLWAMGLRDGQPDAMRLLSEPRGPLMPEYWTDRIWPPEQPHKVFDDLEAWGRTQGLLDRLG